MSFLFPQSPIDHSQQGQCSEVEDVCHVSSLVGVVVDEVTSVFSGSLGNVLVCLSNERLNGKANYYADEEQ